MNDHGISKAIQSDVALGFTRVIIMAGVPLLITLLGYFGARLVTQIDSQGLELRIITKALGDQSSSTLLLQNTVNIRGAQRDDQIRDINGRVADHETRIRVLERPAGLSGPR